MKKLIPATFAATLIATVPMLSACDFKALMSVTPNSDEQTTITEAPERFKFFIRGKKTSSLSDDRKTLTMSIDAVDPDGGDVSIEWSQDKPFGTFNSTRGKDVQWTANRDGNYTVTLTATVRGSLKKDDPDIATFLVPVVDGKINATEIAPEITLAPQSVILFRALPSSLAQSDDMLANVGVKTKAQLTATSYIYDANSNTKVKQSGDFGEIKWASGDPNLVIIDDNGFVRPTDGSAIGATLVTATSKTNSASKAGAQVAVQYLDTAITLSYPTTTIYLNGQGSPNSVKIGATVQYSNPTDRNRIIFTDPNGREITWSSSDPSIAQVDANGNLVPLADAAIGDVVVTAKSNYDPSKHASVTIRVRGNTPSSVNFVAR